MHSSTIHASIHTEWQVVRRLHAFVCARNLFFNKKKWKLFNFCCERTYAIPCTNKCITTAHCIAFAFIYKCWSFWVLAIVCTLIAIMIFMMGKRHNAVVTSVLYIRRRCVFPLHKLPRPKHDSNRHNCSLNFSVTHLAFPFFVCVYNILSRRQSSSAHRNKKLLFDLDETREYSCCFGGDCNLQSRPSARGFAFVPFDILLQFLPESVCGSVSKSPTSQQTNKRTLLPVYCVPTTTDYSYWLEYE